MDELSGTIVLEFAVRRSTSAAFQVYQDTEDIPRTYVEPPGRFFGEIQIDWEVCKVNTGPILVCPVRFIEDMI